MDNVDLELYKRWLKEGVCLGEDFNLIYLLSHSTTF